MSVQLPFPNERVAVVSITKHGIALAGKVVAALPGAQLFAPELSLPPLPTTPRPSGGPPCESHASSKKPMSSPQSR